MPYKLSILIPCIKRHEHLLASVLAPNLMAQISKGGYGNDVEILIEHGEDKSTGAKRNDLLKRASGGMIVYIDSDDDVSEDYISEILKAIDTGCDVVGFAGFMTTRGKDRKPFRISKDLPYRTVKEMGVETYLRHINHLNPIRREIALQIGFPDKTFFEDYDYAVRLKDSGLIKTEYYIDKELYHYKYIPH